MPLYEYQCRACEKRFERIQKFSDPPVTTCPSCGGDVEKLLSSPAIQFKGSGWYITDYAKSGSSGAAKSDSKSGSSSESSGKESTESAPKSDSKSESAPAAAPKTTTTDSK